ncbi:hypothetical protein EZV62_006992 [Acer yangbiense]|uniref:Retrovirus-related Pol polyprotein from transposon TNT 1-94-like beta-barrel domain-containing protein n=1 Tax=Acer yangbiense TaxID=1000413 RepID=A0A5C7I997_9ROSI|nr:hypothetical protein EZV62_006992 [Acer yangbiense]
MQQQTQQPMQQANYTDDHECDEHLFTMSQACMATSTEIWYVDSGCTSHMARDAGMFTTLDRNATTTVKLGNGDMVNAAGKDMQVKSRTYDLCDACLMSKHDMVKDVQATSRTYGLRDACQNGKAPMKPNIDGVFDGHSSNESVMDDGTVAKSDSLFLKTRSSANVYQNCNMMVKEPACNEEAAQMDEKKLAMKEELMMIKRNQAQSSAKAEYIATAAAPKQAKWIKKVSTDLNYVEKKPIRLWCNNSAFSMAKNHVQHGRSKHNNVKFHAIREAEKNGEVS